MLKLLIMLLLVNKILYKHTHISILMSHFKNIRIVFYDDELQLKLLKFIKLNYKL